MGPLLRAVPIFCLFVAEFDFSKLAIVRDFNRIDCIVGFRGNTMSNVVLLDNVEHAHLKVKAERGDAFGDHINQALVFPNEFQALQREYPIVFRKDAAGNMQAVALLGFERDENLFLEDGVWHARYMPAVQARGPFSIGMRNSQSVGASDAAPVIQIDVANPAVGHDDGHPLFLQHGGHSPYLESIIGILETLHSGVGFSKAFFSALEEEKLIEPSTLEVKISETMQYSVPDVYSINEQQFQALSPESLERLHRAGFLAPCVLAMSSLDNISALVERKLRKDEGQYQ